PAAAISSRTTHACGGTLGVAGSSNKNSAAGDASTPTPHAAAISAETPSDSATEAETDLKENETGLFKAFEKASY
ncbi:MAG: hypothetical protein DMF66_05085, partial [Acidobacteria bacterium]